MSRNRMTAPEARGSLPSPKAQGTRPEGARNREEAAARVREMFSAIAPRYDLLNHLLSLSMDRVWRRKTAAAFRHILQRPDVRVLDVCCGTGDLGFAFAARAAHGAQILGADFSLPMLARARRKGLQRQRAPRFLAADTLVLPFADGSFDLVASAFGFRNLADYEGGLQEMARVLKPGGTLAILEFSEPGSGTLAAAFRFYFRTILPRVGGAISGNREAYAYLPSSVGRFPGAGEFSAMIERCGFKEARFARWNFGSVLLHTAHRSA